MYMRSKWNTIANPFNRKFSFYYIIISFYNDRLINHSLFIRGRKINLLEMEEILGCTTASINVKLHLNFQINCLLFKEHQEVTSHTLTPPQACASLTRQASPTGSVQPGREESPSPGGVSKPTCWGFKCPAGTRVELSPRPRLLICVLLAFFNKNYLSF